MALLGPNGVGKTTVARVATGLVRPAAGVVRVEGGDLTGALRPPLRPGRRRPRAEGRSVFATLTVEENLRLSFRRSKGRAGVAAALDRAFDQFPALARRRGQQAATLSGGEQRMLSMAGSWWRRPSCWWPTSCRSVLAPIVVDRIYADLARLQAEGTALLIVEQHVADALALCDRVVLLERGSVAWVGPAADAADRVVAEVFDRPAPAP